MKNVIECVSTTQHKTKHESDEGRSLAEVKPITTAFFNHTPPRVLVLYSVRSASAIWSCDSRKKWLICPQWLLHSSRRYYLMGKEFPLGTGIFSSTGLSHHPASYGEKNRNNQIDQMNCQGSGLLYHNACLIGSCIKQRRLQTIMFRN